MSAYCGLPLQLVLSVPGRTLDLMDEGQGFRVALLDLGYPAVRADTTDAPDRPGSIDTTSLFGSRAVTISGSILDSASGSRSAALALLAPYLDPAARPVLTYQIDSDVDVHSIVLRAASMTAPLNMPSVTMWSAGWVAPDGLALGTVENHAECGPAFLVVIGRTYNLTFDRHYPPSGPSNWVEIVAGGDYPTSPTFTLYGPATGATITVNDESAGSSTDISLQSGFTVGAGHFIVIDCGARTIVDDGGNNVYGDALDTFTTWPVFRPGNTTLVSLMASGATGSTGLDISWYERWLT